MLKSVLYILSIVILMIVVQSCGDNQERHILYEEYVKEALDSNNADTLYMRCYNNLAVESNDETVSGAVWYDCNIQGFTAEQTNFLKQLFNLNTVPTDEALCAWNDGQIAMLNLNTVEPPHVHNSLCAHHHGLSTTKQIPMCGKTPLNLQYSEGFYMRLVVGIMTCNKYLLDFGNENVLKAAEVRALRALYYQSVLHTFGESPMIAVNNESKRMITAQQMYDFLENELLDVSAVLKPSQLPKEGDDGYGKMTWEAAQVMLARLYFGRQRWHDVLKVCDEVLSKTKHRLCMQSTVSACGSVTYSAYQKLFMGDNGTNGAQEEVIFAIPYDGEDKASWYGTTFLTASTYSKTMPQNGLDQQWSGNRARPDLVLKFTKEDKRALFHKENRTLSCVDPSNFENGYAVMKYTNVKTTDSIGSVELQSMASIDYPLMRLAEIIMMKAESCWRVGKVSDCLSMMNMLRKRAGVAPFQAISPDGHEILDEWSREFYFEPKRRCDLVRWGCFSNQHKYNWQWKGGSPIGRDFSVMKNFYTLPVDSLIGKKPEEPVGRLYYLTGDGIGVGTWCTRGGANVGESLMPMRRIDGNDSELVYTDYFTPQMRFKLLRDFDSWDEQYGAGDSLQDVRHNDGGSNGFILPEEGFYSVRLNTESHKLTIEPFEGKVLKYKSIRVAIEDGNGEIKTFEMHNPNVSNARSHMWIADFELPQRGEYKLGIGTSDGDFEVTQSAIHGMHLTINDDKPSEMLVGITKPEKLRVVFNDIDKGLYFVSLTDEVNYEKGYVLPNDINLQYVHIGDHTRVKYGLPVGAVLKSEEERDGRYRVEFELYEQRYFTEVAVK